MGLLAATLPRPGYALSPRARTAGHRSAASVAQCGQPFGAPLLRRYFRAHAATPYLCFPRAQIREGLDLDSSSPGDARIRTPEAGPLACQRGRACSPPGLVSAAPQAPRCSSQVTEGRSSSPLGRGAAALPESAEHFPPPPSGESDAVNGVGRGSEGPPRAQANVLEKSASGGAFLQRRRLTEAQKPSPRHSCHRMFGCECYADPRPQHSSGRQGHSRHGGSDGENGKSWSSEG